MYGTQDGEEDGSSSDDDGDNGMLRWSNMNRFCAYD